MPVDSPIIVRPRPLGASQIRRPVLPHLAQMVFDTPLAILPEKLEVILRAVGPRLTTGAVDQDALDTLLRSGALRTQDDQQTIDQLLAFDNGDDNDPWSTKKSDKPYKTTDAGVAIISVNGVLMKKGTWMTALSGCSSYDQIGKTFDAALADGQVRAILFDIDSPGGTTHGCFELSDHIYEARGDKPVWAIANDLAASAAYAIASSADRIYLTRTAGVGSVGVFAMHCDQSGADEQAGVKFTYIYAGSHKVDGNPHAPLSKSAKSSTQAEVDREYDIFTSTVARNRGVNESKIVDTQAEVFFEDRAIPLLADSAGSLSDVLGELTSHLSSSSATIRRSTNNRSGLSPDHVRDPDPDPDLPTVVTTEGAPLMAVTLADLKARLAAMEADPATATAESLSTLSAEADDMKKGEKKEAVKKPEEKAASPKDKKKDDEKEPDEDDEDCEPSGKKGKSESINNALTGVSGTAVSFTSPTAASEISYLCKLSGFPDMAADFILAETPVTDVRRLLQERRSTMTSSYSISGSTTGTKSDPMDTIVAQAKAMHQSAGGKISLSHCLEQVVSANPELYQAHEEVRAEASLTPGRSREFVGRLVPKLRGLGLSSTSDTISGGRRGL